MKLHFGRAPLPESEDRPITLRDSVLHDLEVTRYQLESAYLGFDYVTDPDLIDSYIYEVNALQKRYKYLLSLVSSLDREKVPEAEAPSEAVAAPVLISSL